MKRIVFIVFMVVMAGVAYGQDVVQYPYHCYMEWPMPLPMDSMFYYEPNNMDGWRLGACLVTRYK